MSPHRGRAQGYGSRARETSAERPGTLARLGAMRWRLVGAALGLLFYAALWVLVVAGATALTAPLVTVPVIVLLIAGGNWLQHWLGITRTPPRFASPEPPDQEDAPEP